MSTNTTPPSTANQSTQTDLNQLNNLMSMAKKSLSISMLLDLAFFSALGFPQETADNLASRMNGGDASTYKFSFAKTNYKSPSPTNKETSSSLPSPLGEKPKMESSYSSTSSSPSPTTTLSSVYKLENNNRDIYYMNPSIYNTSTHVNLNNIVNTISEKNVERLANSLNTNLEIKNISNDLKSPNPNENIISLSNVPKENQESLNETTAKNNSHSSSNQSHAWVSVVI
jgi:hypothetical protein